MCIRDRVDRFMLKVVIDYPKLEEEKLIIRQNINGEKFNVKPILRADEIIEDVYKRQGQELNKIGIEVLRIVSIRDREKEILEAIDNAMERVNIVSVSYTHLDVYKRQVLYLQQLFRQLFRNT